MNYSRKHIKAIAGRKYRAITGSGASTDYKALYWITAKHYSNVKDCYRW